MDKEIIVKLAKARQVIDAANKVMKFLRDEFEQSDTFLAAEEKLVRTRMELDEADAAFRAEALSDTERQRHTKDDPYEIKITKSVNIPDESAAIRWSTTNFTPVLALNKKIFETAVKAGSIPSDLAFVLDVPKVYIKADLSEYL